ncbi:hypothetical protein F5Y05DRAFT_416575 [Hypoxylon sp. FL0543]|nr:hypothetical protein F5Y05DRAFT_416575 [Hypoxylon sp. FL0543]
MRMRENNNRDDLPSTPGKGTAEYHAMIMTNSIKMERTRHGRGKRLHMNKEDSLYILNPSTIVLRPFAYLGRTNCPMWNEPLREAPVWPQDDIDVFSNGNENGRSSSQTSSSSAKLPSRQLNSHDRHYPYHFKLHQEDWHALRRKANCHKTKPTAQLLNGVVSRLRWLLPCGGITELQQERSCLTHHLGGNPNTANAAKYAKYAQQNAKELFGDGAGVALIGTHSYPLCHEMYNDVLQGFTRLLVCVGSKNYNVLTFLNQFKKLYRDPEDVLEDVYMDTKYNLYVLFKDLAHASFFYKLVMWREAVLRKDALKKQDYTIH